MKIEEIEDTWSQYRSRFTARPETFDALVDVWKRSSAMRVEFGGWPTFARYAIAEPRLTKDWLHRVELAQAVMRDYGYYPGLSEHGATTWWRL